ncbi:hypothetical protein L1987_17438 [Smallanthus sonchifolius]|uniref:Uncharacterized protein n=1 Tax=Smallanthus sonchifolius TaxID=185202 RepID=A0ACB9IYY5_9ASTR|nr:hypothetical protein L1987_17438 [Smallanthus sonchifolius]
MKMLHLNEKTTIEEPRFKVLHQVRRQDIGSNGGRFKKRRINVIRDFSPGCGPNAGNNLDDFVLVESEDDLDEDASSEGEENN